MRCILLLLAATVVSAQDKIPSPGAGGNVPIVPVANNPQAALAKLPANLQTHLLAWEKKTAGLQSLYTECEREMTNTLTKKTSRYSGSIRCMKPNLAYLRIDNTAKKDDFTAHICDGKSVYEYSGADKVVKQYLIPAGGKNNVGDNMLLEFMSGAMTAADIANRFTLSLLKEDKHYVYLEIKPILPKDLQEFDSCILVLYGPEVKGLEYLPAKAQMKINNGQAVDEWTFKQPMANPKGIDATQFQYVAPPKDWQVKPADPKVRP